MVLAYDNLCLFEFGIATEIFGLPRPELDVDWYQFDVCSVETNEISGLGGIKIRAAKSIKLLDSADTIIIPGWTPDSSPVALIKKLQNAYRRGARLVSICSGAKLLGEAGLLDGKQVTTHWRYVDQLQERFPNAEVVPDVLYVEDGQIFTSAGSAAGIDLCMHIVRQDYGSKIVNSVARRLVLPAHRTGGQAQYISKPVSKERDSLSPLMDWVLNYLDQPHSVATLAERAHCSERSLLRRFKAATGQTPMQWLISQRIERVKELLETTKAPMDEIVDLAGFNTQETLRHHFRATVGVSPMAYRSAFSA